MADSANATDETPAEPAVEAEAAAVPDKIVCPECGDDFKGIQGIIAHMRNKHQIDSPAAMEKLEAAGYKRGDTGPQKRTQTRRKVTGFIDKDQLLRQVFPKGMPPNGELIQRTGAWLSEAEKLRDLAY